MSDKVRVYEIAEEAGASSTEVIAKAKDLGINLKSPQSAVSYEDAEEITNYIMTGRSSRLNKNIRKKLPIKQLVDLDFLLKDYKNNIDKNAASRNKAISRQKVTIVAKGYQKDITLVEAVENNELTFEEPKNENHEVEKKKLIPKDNSNKKNEIYIKDYPSVLIEISNLKSINYLKWELQKEKGVYGIIGENGTGKSSLLICIAKLVNGAIFQNELVGVGYYDKSKITYTINDKKINFIKNDSTSNNWRQEETDRDIMPKLNGIFESSILTGKRFNKINSYIKNKLEYIENEDTIKKTNKFIMNEMNYILYGNSTHLYRFDELFEITAIRKHQRNKKDKTLGEYTYNYYALKIDESKYLKEQTFSTGEYFLLQLLKFISNYVNNKHHISPLIIIDEIELSLHPLAQERLVKRLKELCEEHNLIVIFASHSLHIVNELDPKDIFYFENKNGKCTMSNPIHKGYLSSRLYQHSHYDKIILVEDDLAKKFITKLIKDENINNILYSIIPIGGWEKVLEIYRLHETQKIYSNAQVIVILDGDVKDKATKGIYNDINKGFLPLENLEKYTVTELYFDNNFKRNIERQFLGYKIIDRLPITIKMSNTEEIKQSFNKGIIEEVSKASGKNVNNYQVEDFIIEEIIKKLKEEENEKIEKFKTRLLDFLK